jgi:hypothetical protein
VKRQDEQPSRPALARGELTEWRLVIAEMDARIARVLGLPASDVTPTDAPRLPGRR